jgi:hypothetical protein
MTVVYASPSHNPVQTGSVSVLVGPVAGAAAVSVSVTAVVVTATVNIPAPSVSAPSSVSVTALAVTVTVSVPAATVTVPGASTSIIGWNTPGGSSAAVGSGYGFEGYRTASGLTYTAVTGDTVTAVAVYGLAPTSGIHSAVAIYTVSGGNPNSLVGSAVAVEIPTGSAGWGTAAASIALSNGVEYTVVWDPYVDGIWDLYYGDGGLAAQQSFDLRTGSPPATWTNDGVEDGRISYYATVTAAGGGSGASVTAVVVTASVSVLAPSVTTAGNATVTATVVTATVTVATATAVTVAFAYPASISSRKLLDQHGTPYLIKGMSSWALAQNCTNAEITAALEGLAGFGFNAVVVAPMGCNNPGGAGWSPYTNDAGQNYFTGTVFQSSLGAAWASVDWLIAEATRLDMTVFFSLFVSWGTTGVAPDIVAAGTTNMYNFGAAVAARYAAYPNIVWHLEGDDNWNYASTGLPAVIDAYHHGISDTEGSTHRLITAEPHYSRTSYDQFISQEGTSGTGYQWFHVDINSPIRVPADESVNVTDAGYTETGATTEAVWIDEPVYVHSGGYGGNELQQVRERNYATFLRGGVGINFGNEYWWPAGAPGLFGGTVTTWLADVLAETSTAQAGYCWTFVDTWCAATTFVPTSAFVTTGLGTGDVKAAAGASGSVAVAYFPDNRTIAVDTTILTGTANVRLRWYDPVANSFSTIAASETQTSGRSVTLPAARGDGTRDYILVVDLLGDVSVTATVVTATVTVIAPTVIAGSTVTATVVTATASVLAPAVSAGSSVTATAVEVVAAVRAPTASGAAARTTTIVTATATVAAPTVTAGSRATPAVVTATVSVPTPAVTASGVASVTALAVTATATALAPTVTAGSRATPTVITATATTPTPTATASTATTALAVTATATVPAPTVSVGSRITATVVTATTTAPTPAISAGATVTITATVVTATTTIPAPAAAAAANPTPTTITATARTLPTTPTAIGQTVTPTTITANVTVYAATILFGTIFELAPHLHSRRHTTPIRSRQPDIITGRDDTTIEGHD